MLILADRIPWGSFVPALIVLGLVLVAGLVLKAAKGLIERRRDPAASASIARAHHDDESVVTLPYVAKPLLTAAEFSFLRALEAAIDGRARVFAQVGLGGVIATERGLTNSERTSAWNRIQSKSFDFVLCHPETLAPLAAVELDDRSHERAERRRRDTLVEDVCRAVGLPLVRFPVRARYSIHELRARLEEDVPRWVRENRNGAASPSA